MTQTIDLKFLQQRYSFCENFLQVKYKYDNSKKAHLIKNVQSTRIQVVQKKSQSLFFLFTLSIISYDQIKTSLCFQLVAFCNPLYILIYAKMCVKRCVQSKVFDFHFYSSGIWHHNLTPAYHYYSNYGFISLSISMWLNFCFRFYHSTKIHCSKGPWFSFLLILIMSESGITSERKGSTFVKSASMSAVTSF